MARTDRECIERCLDGHPEVFGRLVHRYQGPLVSYLTGRLADREQAEEAAQETFVRSYFALGKLRKPESFCSWLFGIAQRVAKEQLRAKGRRAEIASTLPERSRPRPPCHDYDLERAIAGLSKVYRDVILLRYYGDMSCPEVAERLGIPLGTVTKRLSRAYGLLRGSLVRSGREPERKELQP